MTQGNSALSAETGNWLDHQRAAGACHRAAGQLQSVREDRRGHRADPDQGAYPDLVEARLRLYAVVDATPSDVPDHVRRAINC